MEEILPDLFRIQIPLPKSPLKFLNSYVIRNQERSLVIDTGLNMDECFAVLNGSLEKLNIDKTKTDFFITHIHADHFGLVSRLASDKSRIYFSRLEKEIIDEWRGWEVMQQYAARNGFPAKLLQDALNHHPGYKFGLEKVPELTLIDAGTELSYGEYILTCFPTPGHTRGHMCLYEPDKKILFAGDHLLIDITPNIQCFSDKRNPLEQYLTSLDNVLKLDIDIVLPGHRRLFHNVEQRILELKEHHEKRLDEVMALLGDSMKTAYQVASEMTWDIKCDSWEGFPIAQKWFATGEAIAHLRYLDMNGSIARDTREDTFIFYGPAI